MYVEILLGALFVLQLVIIAMLKKLQSSMDSPIPGSPGAMDGEGGGTGSKGEGRELRGNYVSSS